MRWRMIGGIWAPEALVVLFLLVREFWCWYWEQNRVVSLLESIKDLLKDQVDFMLDNIVVTLKDNLTDIDLYAKYIPSDEKTLVSER